MTEDTKSTHVVGFLFSKGCSRVVLIEKAQPAWQKGLLNGIGGKIEPGETSLQAMVREFAEETGYKGEIAWRHFCHYDCPQHGTMLDFFAAVSNEAFGEARTVSDESVIRGAVGEALQMRRTVPNIRWLIPMAVNLLSGRTADTFTIREGLE